MLQVVDNPRLLPGLGLDVNKSHTAQCFTIRRSGNLAADSLLSISTMFKYSLFVIHGVR